MRTCIWEAASVCQSVCRLVHRSVPNSLSFPANFGENELKSSGNWYYCIKILHILGCVRPLARRSVHWPDGTSVGISIRPSACLSVGQSIMVKVSWSFLVWNDPKSLGNRSLTLSLSRSLTRSLTVHLSLWLTVSVKLKRFIDSSDSDSVFDFVFDSVSDSYSYSGSVSDSVSVSGCLYVPVTVYWVSHK